MYTWCWILCVEPNPKHERKMCQEEPFSEFLLNAWRETSRIPGMIFK